MCPLLEISRVKADGNGRVWWIPQRLGSEPLDLRIVIMLLIVSFKGMFDGTKSHAGVGEFLRELP